MSEKSLEPSKDAWEEVGQVLDAECSSVDDIRTDLEKTDKGNVKQRTPSPHQEKDVL